MSAQLFDFVDHIREAPSSRSAAQLFVEFGQKIGACSVNTFFGSNLESQFVSTHPDWWIEYITKTYPDYDRLHMVREVRRGRSPRVVAGIDICPDNPDATSEGLEYINKLYDHLGVRTVCTFPMPDPDGNHRGAGMGLGFQDSGRQFEIRMAESGGMLGVAAFTAFTKMSLLRNKTGTPSPLSPRQHEVLLHLAQGRQISSIADRLGITESAVNLYLKNLKQKLNVKTREQALAQAIVNGWICP